MKTLSYFLTVLIATFCIGTTAYSQELSKRQIEEITAEITTAFEKSVRAAEQLDGKALAEGVDDSLKAGFIVDGNFFGSFEEVMQDFEDKSQGCLSQKMSNINKSITVLSKDSTLLVASGDFLLSLADGRSIGGRFAWSMIYSKVGGAWKIIHANM